jgi:hypothetical protein
MVSRRLRAAQLDRSALLRGPHESTLFTPVRTTYNNQSNQMPLIALVLVIIPLCTIAIVTASCFRIGTDAHEAKRIRGRLRSIVRRLYGVPVLFLGLCCFPAFAIRFLAGDERPHLGDVVLIVTNLLAMGISLYVGFCWLHGRVARFSLLPRIRQFFSPQAHS